jgi:hypothetical protein
VFAGTGSGLVRRPFRLPHLAGLRIDTSSVADHGTFLAFVGWTHF